MFRSSFYHRFFFFFSNRKNWWLGSRRPGSRVALYPRSWAFSAAGIGTGNSVDRIIDWLMAAFGRSEASSDLLVFFCRRARICWVFLCFSMFFHVFPCFSIGVLIYIKYVGGSADWLIESVWEGMIFLATAQNPIWSSFHEWPQVEILHVYVQKRGLPGYVPGTAN